MIGNAISAQARILYAVAARDVMLKHRESPLGVLTAVVEPLATIGMMTLAFSLIRLRDPGLGDYLMLFLMTGIIPISIFRLSSLGGERTFMKLRRSLVLPHLGVLDLVIGGILANFLTLAALFLLITVFFKLVFKVVEPEYWILSLFPGFCNALIGFGFCMVNMTIKSWFPFWGNIFSIITTPLGIASGMFYTADRLPPQVVAYLYYNPFMHSTELTRTFFFPEYTSQFFDPIYYGGWVVGSVAVGLLCEWIFRYRLIGSKA
ncbi:ABC transporter permease [Acuticoccus mangrovi]|uniref:ABC transporter permease n=1 Tax=Acuticoccus mangrovi TaxID=2796142 RepID=A0A934MFN0_9HYPH|nr:ABC transporter permease [Acuticoccus mangrovi]MBJ3775105.1 ABC transporter permease [Acuticoccus mangrovi]